MKVKISLVVMFAALLAAGLAYGDGYNMVSWPLIPHDTSIQACFADSMGEGLQLTGGPDINSSDLVRFYNTATGQYLTSWYNTATFPPVPPQGWNGTITDVDPLKGYWIVIRGAHSAVTLTMTGSVNTGAVTIPVETGPSYNFVGTPFAEDRPLSGTTGDDCGLIASGFTGSANADPAESDKIRYFDGTSYKTSWYNTRTFPPVPPVGWNGTVTALEPGKGYILEVLSGHDFDDDEWIYIANPAKGATVTMERKVRTPSAKEMRELSLQARKQANKSTSTRIGDLLRDVEAKRSR